MPFFLVALPPRCRDKFLPGVKFFPPPVRRDVTYRLYYPLCVSCIIDTGQIVYLSNKDPCPKISNHKSEIKVPWTAMEIHKFQHPQRGSF